MIILEKATAKDIDSVGIIDAMVLGHTGRRAQLQQAIYDRQCFVAKVDQAVAGFLIWDNSFFGQAFISLLMVHPRYRQHGIGTHLMQHVEAIIPAKRWFTSTNLSNKRMQRLCEKLGYQRSGFIDNLDEGDPEIVYCKRIKS